MKRDYSQQQQQQQQQPEGIIQTPLHIGGGDYHHHHHQEQHHPSAFHAYTRPQKRLRNNHSSGDDDSSSSASSSNSSSSSTKRVSFSLGAQGRHGASRRMLQQPVEQKQYTIFPLPMHEEEEDSSTSIIDDGAPSLFETLTEEDCLRLWYQKTDMLAAKDYVRSLVINRHHHHPHHDTTNNDDDHASSNTATATTSSASASNTEMCGLHKFCSWERSHHKKSAIWYIMAAHRENPHNHDFVRDVSARCTEWARHVAEQEGFANYCDVYGDPLDTLLLHDMENIQDWEEELCALNGSSAQLVGEDKDRNKGNESEDENDKYEPLRWTPVDDVASSTSAASESAAASSEAASPHHRRNIPSVTPPHSPPPHGISA